jgi:hypothetical protein
MVRMMHAETQPVLGWFEPNSLGPEKAMMEEEEEEAGSDDVGGPKELDRFAEDSERGNEPLLLSSHSQPSSSGNRLRKWHRRQREALLDGLCTAGYKGAQAYRVHVIDHEEETNEAARGNDDEGGGGGTDLFARVDPRSGFARTGLADADAATFTGGDDSNTGGDNEEEEEEEEEQEDADDGVDGQYQGPWAPLLAMRTRNMPMRSLLDLVGVPCNVPSSSPAADEAEEEEEEEVQAEQEQDHSTSSSSEVVVARVAGTARHRLASWSGAVPASVRSKLFSALASFFPEGRPGAEKARIFTPFARGKRSFVKTGSGQS